MLPWEQFNFNFPLYPKRLKTKPVTPQDHLLIIGSSTGGPRALMEIVPKLPASLPTSIIVIQHILPKFIPVLTRRLKKESCLTVERAKDGDTLKKGHVYLAPGDQHIELSLKNDRVGIVFNPQEPIGGVRPSIDLFLFSAIEIFKANILALILTGMGRDGCEGARRLRKTNGFVIAEAQETCMVFGMPKAVIQEGLANLVVPLYNIPQIIIKYFNSVNS